MAAAAASSSSSTPATHHPPPTSDGTTTSPAPPPTPSTQQPLSSSSSSSSSSSIDALSHFLRHLPTSLSLSLPTARLRSSTTAATAPLISLSDLPHSLETWQAGFLQLIDHQIPAQIANSADLQSQTLFNLPSLLPSPVPFHENDGDGEPLCFDIDSIAETRSTDSSSLPPAADLIEFAESLQKVGLLVIEGLCSALDLKNPLTKPCCLVWITNQTTKEGDPVSDRLYPYVINLQYQFRCQKHLLLTDSGWISVKPQIDTILVTLGDIFKVWSNGRCKNVNGRPVASCEEEDSSCISMSLMITLPMDSVVSPLLILKINDDEAEEEEEEGEEEEENDGNGRRRRRRRRRFCDFQFKEYAWRVYQQRRLFFKDPLDKYRLL